jgi:hypothetical protein
MGAILGVRESNEERGVEYILVELLEGELLEGELLNELPPARPPEEAASALIGVIISPAPTNTGATSFFKPFRPEKAVPSHTTTAEDARRAKTNSCISLKNDYKINMINE